jgi:hypothetical protein
MTLARGSENLDQGPCLRAMEDLNQGDGLDDGTEQMSSRKANIS